MDQDSFRNVPLKYKIRRIMGAAALLGLCAYMLYSEHKSNRLYTEASQKIQYLDGEAGTSIKDWSLAHELIGISFDQVINQPKNTSEKDLQRIVSLKDLPKSSHSVNSVRTEQEGAN